MPKIGQIFPKKKFCEEHLIILYIILMNFFENFDFKVLYLVKMCPIFVGSVHNFGKSDDDII